MYDRSISPVDSLAGSGRSAVMLTGTRAPDAELTFWPKLVMPWILKNPPGQRPSFCVSTFSVYSARPPYFATSSVPPVMTPWGICVRSTSSSTPLLPSSSRSPNQLPVSRGRSHKLPPHVGGMSTGCALANVDVARTNSAASECRAVCRFTVKRFTTRAPSRLVLSSSPPLSGSTEPSSRDLAGPLDHLTRAQNGDLERLSRLRSIHLVA